MPSSNPSESISCAVCGNTFLEMRTIGGLRRAACSQCQHGQRVDYERFDYENFAMGATGAAPDRVDSQVQFVKSHLPVSGAPLRALEIGCAKGALANALKAAREFVCFDGIELSSAKAAAAEIMSNVFDIPLTACIEQKLIATSSYDLVIISHCLEHLTNLHEEITGIKRVMTESGLLFIEVPNLSGHALLPFDDNRSHIHFFSLSSLTRLLAAHGLETFVASTDERHDARYPNALRVLARPYTPFPAINQTILSDVLREKKVVIWGAGKMCAEVLEHFFDPSKIEFFVDSDKSKHGTQCMGRPVKDTKILAEDAGHTVLINSLEYEVAIRKQLDEQFKNKIKQVIGIGELLDELSRR